jgi:hypothetical protein
MRKASISKVNSIWFDYGIPIGSRRILRFPRYSDYRIHLSEIVGSDIRQLLTRSCRKLSDSSRKLSDYLGFPVGCCRSFWGFLLGPTGAEPGKERKDERKKKARIQLDNQRKEMTCHVFNFLIKSIENLT